MVSHRGGVLIVHSNFDVTTGIITLDKTWDEIHDALSNYIVVIRHNISDGAQDFPIQCGITDNNIYYINTVMSIGNQMQYGYTTDSPNGYPSIED